MKRSRIPPSFATFFSSSATIVRYYRRCSQQQNTFGGANRGCCYCSPYRGRDIARTEERPVFKPQHRRHYPTSARSKNSARQATGLLWLRQSEAVRKVKQFGATVLLLHTRRTQGRWLPDEARGRKAQRRKKLSATLCTDCPGQLRGLPD